MQNTLHKLEEPTHIYLAKSGKWRYPMNRKGDTEVFKIFLMGPKSSRNGRKKNHLKIFIYI